MTEEMKPLSPGEFACYARTTDGRLVYVEGYDPLFLPRFQCRDLTRPVCDGYFNADAGTLFEVEESEVEKAIGTFDLYWRRKLLEAAAVNEMGALPA